VGTNKCTAVAAAILVRGDASTVGTFCGFLSDYCFCSALEDQYSETAKHGMSW
jgi:hypothetical protein